MIFPHKQCLLPVLIPVLFSVLRITHEAAFNRLQLLTEDPFNISQVRWDDRSRIHNLTAASHLSLPDFIAGCVSEGSDIADDVRVSLSASMTHPPPEVL